MATIVGAFTNPLKNGTTEDATQVMNLFSFIQSQVNSNACPSTAGQAILKGDGSGGTTSAIAGTDYCAATSGSAILKGNSSGGTVAAVDGTDYLSPVAPSPSHVYRNAIINGCLREDPAAGAAVTYTAGAALAVAAEMFYAYCTGANVTGQQVAAADGTKRWQFTGAASVTGIGLGTRIEAANVVEAGLAGQTCTLSVLLQNTMSGAPSVAWAAYYANTADSFGTLASPTRTAIANGTFAATGTEALFTAQIAVPAAATTGIELVFSVGAQTSGNLSFGKLQLERGAVPASAVIFERVDKPINRRRCQDYYRVAAFLASGVATAASQDVYAQVTWDPMRIAPQAVKVNGSFTNCTDPVAPSVTNNSYQALVRSAAAGTFLGNYTLQLNARLF